MLREIWQGTEKQLSFMRVALTPSVLSCCFGIVYGSIKGDPTTIAACGAALTGILFAKSSQSRVEETPKEKECAKG